MDVLLIMIVLVLNPMTPSENQWDYLKENYSRLYECKATMYTLMLVN